MYHPATVISGNKDLEAWDKRADFKDKKLTWIPCGQCKGCRIDNSREWADRGYLEGLYYPNINWFVTCTINDESLKFKDRILDKRTGEIFEHNGNEEWGCSLIPKSAQLFMKRLRKYMKDKYKVDGIRVMYCGEYGDEGGRPHYHFIIFNCPLPIESFYAGRLDYKKDYYWQNEIIEKCWSDPKTEESYGFSNITEANWNNMAYVGRYITKKLNGELATELYYKAGREPIFFRVSNQPGIARQYYEDHKDKIYDQDKILIKQGKEAFWTKPPKYFDELYKKENPERFEEIQLKRSKEQLNALIVKGEKTSLTRWEQLQIEMRSKELAIGTLKRNL